MLMIHSLCINIKRLQKLNLKFSENIFENISDWFVENKLSIHFDVGKAKSILFASKRKN